MNMWTRRYRDASLLPDSSLMFSRKHSAHHFQNHTHMQRHQTGFALQMLWGNKAIAVRLRKRHENNTTLRFSDCIHEGDARLGASLTVFWVGSKRYETSSTKLRAVHISYKSQRMNTISQRIRHIVTIEDQTSRPSPWHNQFSWLILPKMSQTLHNSKTWCRRMWSELQQGTMVTRGRAVTMHVVREGCPHRTWEAAGEHREARFAESSACACMWQFNAWERPHCRVLWEWKLYLQETFPVEWRHFAFRHVGTAFLQWMWEENTCMSATIVNANRIEKSWNMKSRTFFREETDLLFITAERKWTAGINSWWAPSSDPQILKKKSKFCRKTSVNNKTWM